MIGIGSLAIAALRGNYVAFDGVEALARRPKQVDEMVERTNKQADEMWEGHDNVPFSLVQ